VAEFEIGVVYQKANRLFIAIEPSTLISCRGGTMTRVKPVSRYSPVRTISVEVLCERWGIGLDEFDAMMSTELAPPKTATKTRPRGSRRSKDADDDYWRLYRTGRIARPKLK